MVSTSNELSQTKRNSSARRKKEPSGTGTTGGDATNLKLTKKDAVFLGTLIVEAARMIGVRDSSPDPTMFKSASSIVENIYEDYINADD